MENKSNGKKYKKTEKAIKEIHPYKVPEIIAMSIIEGSREYLKWMEKEI